MAIWYVDDAAGGANNGTSWGDAWVSLATSESGAATAGDTVLVASTHDEQPSSSQIVDWVNGTKELPILVISTNTSDDTYAAGASYKVNTGAGVLQAYGNFSMYGMTFGSTQGGVKLTVTTGDVQSYEDCTIPVGDGAGDDLTFTDGPWGILTVTNCTITLADQMVCPINTYGKSRFTNCDITNNGAATVLVVLTGGQRQNLVFEGCDLTDWDTLVDKSAMGEMCSIHFAQCQLKSSFAVSTGTFPVTIGQDVTVERSHSDTDLTDPKLGLQEQQTHEGITKALLTKYRTNGATDGEQANEHSWEMVTNATSLEYHHPMYSPWCAHWVPGGAQITATFHIAGGATLQDDDFWIEAFTPDDTATSTTMADYRTSRMANPLATPANITTDTTSTWNGSGVGTMQQISFTFTPDIPGPMEFRACLAKPSTTVYFDPLAVLS